MPVLLDEQTKVISRLINGIAKLYSLRVEVHEDYQTGGITDTHHADIMEHIYSSKERMQNVLGQYFTDEFMLKKPIPLDMLRRYYMTDYLLKEDFIMLRKRFYDNGSPPRNKRLLGL